MGLSVAGSVAQTMEVNAGSLTMPHWIDTADDESANAAADAIAAPNAATPMSKRHIFPVAVIPGTTPCNARCK